MASPSKYSYNENIFINAPFDKTYKKIFNAIIFAVFHCGFRTRCALEEEGADVIRIEKICKIIKECKYGIHDISCTELDKKSNLPRFNMPFELGIFFGAKKYGAAEQKNKKLLILDRERYRYQTYCSDIAGQDIHCHEGKDKDAILCIRNWLSTSKDVKARSLPSGKLIYENYLLFNKYKPKLCKKYQFDELNLKYGDYITLVSGWLKAKAKAKRIAKKAKP